MPSRSEFAVRFAVASALLLLLAGGIAAGLIRLFPVSAASGPIPFSVAFLASTTLLLIGSLSMSRALGFVRRERQVPFRRHLLYSLVVGTLFVSSQTYALTCLIRQLPPDEKSSAGAGAFVVVIAALHAVHFVVALLFLVFVTIQALEERYDHEYYWGVTICSWFWHILGVIWLLVLVVMLIVASLSPVATLAP